MTQNAVVKRLLDGATAEVEVERKSACGHDCSKCGGCAEMSYVKQVTALAENKVGASVGDRVVIETENRSIFGVMALVYALPLVLFFAGYAIAVSLTQHEAIGGIVGAAGFVLGILGAVLYNKKLKGRSAVHFVIVAKS